VWQHLSSEAIWKREAKRPIKVSIFKRYCFHHCVPPAMKHFPPSPELNRAPIQVRVLKHENINLIQQNTHKTRYVKCKNHTTFTVRFVLLILADTRFESKDIKPLQKQQSGGK
jgi:hypothetical protein